jgi:hypothetical protein
MKFFTLTAAALAAAVLTTSTCASQVKVEGEIDLTSDSSSETPNVLRNLQQKFPMCGKPMPMCKKNRGRCMSKEDCYRALGEEWARWVPNTEKEIVCKTRTAPEDSVAPCGCCMKRAEDEDEKESNETPVTARLQAVGLAVEDSSNSEVGTNGFRLSLSMDEADGIADVSMMTRIGDELYSFNNFAGQAFTPECSGSMCKATVKGNMYFPKLDELFPPVEANPNREKADTSGPGRDIDTLMPWERESTDSTDGTEPTHGRLLGRKGKPADSGETSKSHDDLLPVEDAVFLSQFVPCALELTFEDPRANPDVQSLKKSRELEKLVEVQGAVDVSIECFPTDEQKNAGVKDLAQAIGRFPLATKWANVIILEPKFPTTIKLPELLLRERKKNMCVQPVRTAYRRCLLSLFGLCWLRSPFYTYSGSGLAFGRPGADEQWGKVDITFTWRPWITIYDSTGKYQSLTTGDEMDDLRAEVSVDDCVEVFFVRSFSPSDTYGGGACWGSGTANAKIISSDEQVACGVDQTHLAHELGHALGLMHPGSGGVEGSTGTLLCPSGWQRDNPRRNSRDNGNNVVNPLLVNYWGVFTLDSHECNDSASCGTCSAHIPSDSC